MPGRASHAGLAVAALTLALGIFPGSPATGHAHVIPLPGLLESGRTATIELSGRNERAEPMTGFALLAPEGVSVVRADPAGSWRVAGTSSSQATWAGGTLAPDEDATFVVELETTLPPGPVALTAEQRYPGGEVARWKVALTVVPGPEEDRGDAGTALTLAAVGLLGIGGLAAVAWSRRSRPRPGHGR